MWPLVPAEDGLLLGDTQIIAVYGLLAVQQHLIQSRITACHVKTFMTRNPAPYRGRQRGADRHQTLMRRPTRMSIEYWGVPASVRGVIDRAIGVCVDNNLNRVNAAMDEFLARHPLTC